MARLILSIFALWLACSPLAQAHKASDSYLSLNVHGQQIDGQWDIALRDLDFAIGLDGDGNGELTWDEIRSRHAQIAAYALARLHLGTAQGSPAVKAGTAVQPALQATLQPALQPATQSATSSAALPAPAAQDCPLQIDQHLIDQHTDGAYAVLRFHATCNANISQLMIDYHLLFDLDPQHKGLLKLNNANNGGSETTTAIFSPQQPQQTLILAGSSKLGQFADYVKTGVWHIWIGFDHILFLLSLLLPAVLILRGREWQAAGSFKAVLLDVLKVVSAFTLAHSITLSLATLQILALPSRWVESAIAASVLIAAINNLKPLVHGRRWVAAFGFGLIHGFGFASVLLDLGLPSTSLVLALGGFNIGVELGQLAIVALFLPLAFWLRGTRVYRRVLFSGGSMAIAALACVWLVERAWDLKLEWGWLA